MSSQIEFLALEKLLSKISKSGDVLETWAKAVDFEIFRDILDGALSYSDGSKGGRPPFDPVLMFKVLLLQAYHSLSDASAAKEIMERLTWRRFLGLGLDGRTPDSKTIWAFRERLIKAGVIEDLFDRFDAELREAGYIAKAGQIVDSTLVAAPKQRNSKDENDAIKSGKSADEIWPDAPAKACHKDTDARWTVQSAKAPVPADGQTAKPNISIPWYGYKSHASIDKGNRFIRKWDVTSAAVHDGRTLRGGLLDKTNSASGVWADSAYRSKRNEEYLAENGFKSHIHRRKPRGKPMPKHIRRGNATRSRHRAPVEHVFAVQKHMMGLTIRTIGLERAKMKIGMSNLVYNIRRLIQLEKRAKCLIA